MVGEIAQITTGCVVLVWLLKSNKRYRIFYAFSLFDLRVIEESRVVRDLKDPRDRRLVNALYTLISRSVTTKILFIITLRKRRPDSEQCLFCRENLGSQGAQGRVGSLDQRQAYNYILSLLRFLELITQSKPPFAAQSFMLRAKIDT